ncbi:MAG: serine protease [Opitutales bacterium]|nr:serine protease [Opitutales bacterium]
MSEQVSFSGEVVAYGNSMGTGVITRERGEIMGMGSGMVEVTAQIVPGNSGGPVVGADDTVVGVSTLVISGTDNWVTEGSRYSETRRYATILRNGMQWEPISWNDFYRHTRSFAEYEQKFEETIELASSILQNPINNIPLSVSDFSEDVGKVLKQHQEDIRHIDNLRSRGLQSANQIHSLNRSFLNRHQTKMKSLADILVISNRTRREWEENLAFPYWQEQIKNHLEYRQKVEERLREEANREQSFFYLR